ncbi:hypothetical protein [Anaeromyxobacter oryzae]|uniref:Uncharacterized protein n=1 Tax=Anaeromyxobacter oryzae TaxID=2918170 RepID=A0ABM7WP61_9BACT|nr:hypothetical protein [Anaeromyxobacter oryzae]BDG01252.1 hypothetical protein AMOR_02480 [Anaeromyxobacter oryzae]
MRFPTFAVLATLLACAAPAHTSAQAEVAARGGPYTVDLVDEGGAVLPTFEHRGRTYVLGSLGRRYLVRVRNGTPRRVEVVVSVDGRDVLDGRPAALERRGYVVEPWGEVTVDGYRLSLDAVAAFRFSSVPRSYAARKGDARDVGVIGVAVFRERTPPPIAAPYPRPYEEDERAPYDGDPSASRARPGAAAPEARSDAVPAQPAPGATANAERRRGTARPGLGTEFAEEHGSRAYRVTFQRESARPAQVVTLRYDDRDGLLALGVDVDRAWYGRADDAWLRETAQPFRRSGFAEPPPGWRER